MFLIRTVSEEVFLIETIHVKPIEKNFLLVNEVFSYLDLKIFLYVRIKTSLSVNNILISSGSTRKDLFSNGSDNLEGSARYLIFNYTLKRIFQTDFCSTDLIIHLFDEIK